MDEFGSLNHTRWESLYHVVFRPKGRRKTLCVSLTKHLRELFRRLAEQKERAVSKMAI